MSCRYDDLKTAQENIDLQTTILSRFDLIFIVKDERSMDRDKMIASHVLNVHKNASAALDTQEEDRKVHMALNLPDVFCQHLVIVYTTVLPRSSSGCLSTMTGQYHRNLAAIVLCKGTNELVLKCRPFCSCALPGHALMQYWLTCCYSSHLLW